MRMLILLAVFPLSLAFQFPFKIPSIFRTQATSETLDFPTPPPTPKIAIVGAGAGGTSAAFWISKAKERFGLDIDIDIYETSSYVGGRSTVVYPYDNTSLPPVELGASIFVKANKNLWRAADEFNLSRRALGEESYETGIWDGENIVVTVGDSWLDTLKLLWRYGLSPKRMQSLVADMIKKFIKVYEREPPRWQNIRSLAETLGFTFTGNTTADYLTFQGVSDLFAQEIVEAATRVNYAQNVDALHALEGLVSMATSGATGVQGGNRQIFEQFAIRSGAEVFLNTAVTSIKPKSDSSHHWVVNSARGSAEYAGVIIATPYHSSNITIPESLSSQIPEQPYVQLHVTLLTTTSPRPDPTYFALPSSSNVPRMILTTYRGARAGGKEPEFNSLSYHGLVNEGDWAVKIFSHHPISDEWLAKVFGKVGWVHRKLWESYPLLPPTSHFPPIRLDRGLFYVNAFEPFISTMETETVASRNVVDLLLNEEFHIGLCGPSVSAEENVTAISQASLGDAQEDFVYGWDC